MKLPFNQSKYLRVTDGYWRMFIRWAYHKYLNELYIPQGTKVKLGHGIKDVSDQHNGYGVTVLITSPGKGVQHESISFRENIIFTN